MALLFNPVGGDDPEPEDDDGYPEHAPSCRCDLCEEERAINGTDDPDYDDSGPDPGDFMTHPEGCMCERCL